MLSPSGVAGFCEINKIIWRTELSSRIEGKGLFRVLANLPRSPVPAGFETLHISEDCNGKLVAANPPSENLIDG